MFKKLKKAPKFQCKRKQIKDKAFGLTNMEKTRIQRRKKEEKYRKPKVKAMTKEQKVNILQQKFGTTIVEKVLQPKKKYGSTFEHNDRRYFHNECMADTKINKIRRKILIKQKQSRKKKPSQKNDFEVKEHLKELLEEYNQFLAFHFQPIKD